MEQFTDGILHMTLQEWKVWHTHFIENKNSSPRILPQGLEEHVKFHYNGTYLGGSLDYDWAREIVGPERIKTAVRANYHA